jgi:hypothetical protein
VCRAAKRFQLSRGDKLRPSSPIPYPPRGVARSNLGETLLAGFRTATNTDNVEESNEFS